MRPTVTPWPPRPTSRTTEPEDDPAARQRVRKHTPPAGCCEVHGGVQGWRVASCEVVGEQNFLVQDINTSVPQQTVSPHVSTRDWNALVAPYDAPLTIVFPALQEAGLPERPTRIRLRSDRHQCRLDPRLGRRGRPPSPRRTAGSPTRGRPIQPGVRGRKAVDQGVKDKFVIKSNAPPRGRDVSRRQRPQPPRSSGSGASQWPDGVVQAEYTLVEIP